MGKSNRVRTERAAFAASNVSTKKTNKNKASKGYSIAIILVAVFVLVTIIASIITSSGFLMRSAKAMKSKNYTITGSMFKYMVMSGYDEFLNNYSSYLSYFSLDTSKPLANQTYGTGNETAFLGSFEGTWLDYFVEPAKAQAEQILIYCEEADARGIKLDDTDKGYIDDAIAVLEDEAKAAGYKPNAYVSSLYGDGIKIKDIRAMMELSSLASKAAEAVDKEILDGITEDEINGKYDADPKKYNVVEYSSYSIGVSYKEVAKEVIEGYDGKAELTDEQKAAVLVEYKKRIEEIKEVKAMAFMNYGDVESFMNAVLRDVADESFDDLYESEALVDADKLAENNLTTVKNAMINKVMEELNNPEITGGEPSDDTVENDGVITAYGVTVTANAAKAIDNIKTKLVDSVESAEELYGTQKQSYSESGDFAKWAFEDARRVGSMNTIYSGDGSKDGEIKNESGYFSADIYFIEKPQHRDETYSKDVAYMSFSTRDAALAAIEAIKSGEKLELSRFEAIAKEKGAMANGLFENYIEGQLTYNGFEEWLYDDNTIVGSYTQTPLANATTSATEYAIFFYVENGDKLWHIDVQNDIFVDDYQAYYKTLTEKYPVTTNEKIIAKVDI